MKTIGAYEAKSRLSALLAEVEAGAKITITKHGRPVAILLPASGATADLEGVIAKLRRFAQKHRLGRMPIRELIDEGRD